MAKLSKNKLYKLSGTFDPYNVWLVKEKTLHAEKMTKNKTKIYDFETWLNERYDYLIQTGQIGSKKTINADGSIKDAFKTVADTAKETLMGTLNDKLSDKTDAEKIDSELNKPVEKRILGLKPVIFYSVTTVTILAIGAGIYFIVKSKGKKG